VAFASVLAACSKWLAITPDINDARQDPLRRAYRAGRSWAAPTSWPSSVRARPLQARHVKVPHTGTFNGNPLLGRGRHCSAGNMSPTAWPKRRPAINTETVGG